jgi:hypothetical protein
VTYPARATEPRWGMVLGGASCVWTDVGRLEALVGGPWPGLILATNTAGADWPYRLDHWVTFHPEKLHAADPTDGSGDWLRIRRERGFPGGFKTWARRAPDLVDEVLEPWGGGSSGHFGVRVFHHVGCTRVVLCGVPMTETGHYHREHDGAPWKHADLHWKSWLRHYHRIDGWVRSMSGRTADKLGRPDMHWLRETLDREAA